MPDPAPPRQPDPLRGAAADHAAAASGARDDRVHDLLAPLLARLEALERRVADLEAGELRPPADDPAARS